MTILNLELKQNWKFSIHGGFVFVCLLVLHEIVILIHALRLNSILLLAVCNKYMQESDYVEFRKKSSPLNYIEGGDE